MLQLPPSDPRNWYRNALVHMMDCSHGNWWFLPWHRAYIGWFEARIRDLSGDGGFALPYWDWTQAARIPAVMFEDVLDPRHEAFMTSFADFKKAFDKPLAAFWSKMSAAQRDSLARRKLHVLADVWQQIEDMFFPRSQARGISHESPALDRATTLAVSADTLRTALRSASFSGDADNPAGAGFASGRSPHHHVGGTKGVLECQPHDNIHEGLGGVSDAAFMTLLLSPVDPIFFLHHSNIDRLWDLWNRRQQALRRPVLPEGAELARWSDEPFLFFSDARGRPVSATAAHYRTTDVFRYDYAPGWGEDLVPAGRPDTVAAPRSRHVDLPIDAEAVASGARAGGGGALPAGILIPADAYAPLPVIEITLDLHPSDKSRRFTVLVSWNGGTPVEVGAITSFKNHNHGARVFTLPLLSGHAAAVPVGSDLAVDIRIVPFADGDAAGQPQASGAAATIRAIRIVTT